MYLLEGICEMSSLDPLWDIVGYVIKAIWIGVPILLIVLGSIDLGKAVIAQKEDEVKKYKKLFINRLLYAVAVFAVVWLVGVIFTLVGNIGFDGTDQTVTSSWNACWQKIIN